MLQLKSITLREILLPLRESFQISSGLAQDRRILLIELDNHDGQSGWGECVAGEYPNYSRKPSIGAGIKGQITAYPQEMHYEKQGAV